ncbi:MAG TPA: APC family permease [Vicinamibacterales bacterium]|nr:APC family permease [Vicinamibacterales bacterium]
MTKSEQGLVRAIGTFGLAAGIINITIGGGIFVLPATVAQTLGPSAPIAYLVCAAAMALIVLCIADAGSRVSLTGGPYAYVGTAFGPYAGFLSGVLLWMLGVFATAAVANAFATTAGVLAPALAGRVMQIALLTVTLIFWSVINVRGVTLGVRLNSIATIAKLFPLLLVAIGGAFFIQPANLRADAIPTAGEIARSSLVLIFAFAGIESALVPSGEVRDPARTVPRAIALAMVTITVLYIALQLVAQGVLGDALVTTGANAPLAETAGAALGGWARSLLLIGAAVSMFGYLGGMTLAMPRILFALAEDRFLPKALAQVHPAYRSPHVAIIVQSFAALVLAVSGTFEQLAILANASALALYFGCALASWRLRQRGVKGEGKPIAIPGAAVLPWITCAVIAWLLTGLRSVEWLGFIICIGIATMIYQLTRAGRVRPR